MTIFTHTCNIFAWNDYPSWTHPITWNNKSTLINNTLQSKRGNHWQREISNNRENRKWHHGKYRSNRGGNTMNKIIKKALLKDGISPSGSHNSGEIVQIMQKRGVQGNLFTKFPVIPMLFSLILLLVSFDFIKRMKDMNRITSLDIGEQVFFIGVGWIDLLERRIAYEFSRVEQKDSKLISIRYISYILFSFLHITKYDDYYRSTPPITPKIKKQTANSIFV